MYPYYTFLRHSESITNKYNKDLINPSSSIEGQESARHLYGNYDYILISPLNRTKETYELSNFKSNNVEVKYIRVN